MRAHSLDLLDGGTRLPIPLVRRLPAGDFLMGAAGGEYLLEADDQPQHNRRIGAFAMAQTPTQFTAYQAYCRAADLPSPDENGWSDGEQPVINVSWLDAQGYAAWLRLVTGERWRLPSEAEWEYACRAGSPAEFAFGDNLEQLKTYGWFNGNSGGRAHPAARLEANRIRAL